MSTDRRCPKCGGDKVTGPLYCDGLSPYCRFAAPPPYGPFLGGHGDHLTYTCARCGYAERELCVDEASRKPS